VLSNLWSADLPFNMAQFTADSSELLDFLFDQSNGILTHDKYMTNGYAESQQFSEQFKPMDFGFVSNYDNFLTNLKCLI